MVVEFLDSFDGVVMIRQDRRIIINDRHDRGRCYTFEMHVWFVIGRVPQERRNEDSSLFHLDRVIVFNHPL